jgi:hypothetical protein
VEQMQNPYRKNCKIAKPLYILSYRIILGEANMTQIILEISQLGVIKKLQNLANQNQRTLEAEITAILENAVESMPITTPEHRGWLPGFFEEVIGGWEGEPLVREPQPETQEREFFE